MNFVTPNPGKPTYMFGLVTTGIDPIETFDTGWYRYGLLYRPGSHKCFRLPGVSMRVT